MTSPKVLFSRPFSFQYWHLLHVPFEQLFDIASYADNITPYISAATENLVNTEFEISCTNLFKWFRENHLKSKRDECHILVTSRNPVRSCLKLTSIHSFNVFRLGKKKLVKSYMLFQELQTTHGVKSVRIRSYFWSLFSCIQSEYRKIRTRNNSVFGNFSCSDMDLEKWKLLIKT